MLGGYQKQEQMPLVIRAVLHVHNNGSQKEIKEPVPDL